jgi:hypothetical protein
MRRVQNSSSRKKHEALAKAIGKNGGTLVYAAPRFPKPSLKESPNVFPFHRLDRQSLIQCALAFVAAASWLSGCGDDETNGGGKGGSSGTAGAAGSGTGGTMAGSGGAPTGGSAGSPSGGSGGAPTGGTAGSGGSGGSAGTATGGDTGMGGEGGAEQGGQGGVGQGGEGGSSDVMCTGANLGIAIVSSDPAQLHDHLPINGASRAALVSMINTGSPLVFTLPMDGSNPHDHTLTFTAQQLTVLRNGGALAMNIRSSMGGPTGNIHTHLYSIECEP